MNHFSFDERPFLVIWEITQACGLVCRHCRAEARPGRHPLELSTAEGRRLIDQIARANPSVLVLTGGDPMERTDLPELIEYATEQGLRVALSPSATTRFLEADLQDLKRRGLVRIAMSLDGASREVHDAFRGVPGTWELTMKALLKTVKAKIPVQINTTFSRQNIHEFDQFPPILKCIKPALWSVFLLVPTGRAQVDDMLSADEVEHLFNRIHDLSETAPYDIKTTEGQHYRRIMLQRSSVGARRVSSRAPLGINDGKGFAFVSHTGDVCPSGFLPLPAGNVRTGELLDIYRDHPLFRQLRDTGLLKGKCGRCEYRNICGGSRSRAYAVSGDFLAEEPLCAYQPAMKPRQAVVTE